MKSALNLLLLAGSAEAREIAIALQDRVQITALLSERERGSAPLPIPHQVRVFDSADALEQTMRAKGNTAVLDASHGFDEGLSAQGFAAATAMGLPFLCLTRAPWSVTDTPRWQRAASVEAACALAPPGARVFATTGWDSQRGFAEFAGAKLLLRQTRSHDRAALFDFIEPVFGLPPFTKASETQLFEEMGVDMLIARNLGGARSRPKLDAATALGLDVVLVDRPTAPKGARVVLDVAAALDWVADL